MLGGCRLIGWGGEQGGKKGRYLVGSKIDDFHLFSQGNPGKGSHKKNVKHIMYASSCTQQARESSGFYSD